MALIMCLAIKSLWSWREEKRERTKQTQSSTGKEENVHEHSILWSIFDKKNLHHSSNLIIRSIDNLSRLQVNILEPLINSNCRRMVVQNFFSIYSRLKVNLYVFYANLLSMDICLFFMIKTVGRLSMLFILPFVLFAILFDIDHIQLSTSGNCVKNEQVTRTCVVFFLFFLL